MPEQKVSEGKLQVEKTIEICKEAIEKLSETSGAEQTTDVKKRIGDVSYVLESMRNKIFFKTKASLSFTMPTLSSAERLFDSIDDRARGNGDIDAVLNELDGLETNLEILKVKVASQDIIIT